MDYTINTKMRTGRLHTRKRPNHVRFRSFSQPLTNMIPAKTWASSLTLKLKDISIQDYRILPTTMLQPRSQLSRRYLWYADFFRTGSKLLRCLQYLRSRQPYRFLLFHLWRNLQPSCSYNEKNGRRRYLR